MHLIEMTCRGFRCLEPTQFRPGRGINVIRGGNAQGKTSLLEAVLFAATTRSHRTNTDGELPRYGSGEFHVHLMAQRADREVTVETHFWQGAKRFKVNGVPQTRLSDLLGRIPVVFFCPEDVALVRGAAGVRRRFLDAEISQVDAQYLHALQQFRQVLRQRNELLKQAKADASMLDVWDVQLVSAGSKLVRARRTYISELGVLAAEAYQRISGAEPLSLRYEPDADAGEALQYALDRGREGDIRRGLTSRGPQRDDVAVMIGEQPARAFGSQGQQKSAALALKLAEVLLVHRRTGEFPLLMLDEVLAELDDARAQRLFETIDSQVQCLVTTTELEHRAGRFGRDTMGFRIAGGRLIEA
jgi:DNA replication and repair protein RecF